MKYAAIADWAQEKQYSVTFMCDQLGVTRQGYYRWRAAGPCQRQRTDAEVTEAILAIHTNLLDPRQEIVVCSRDLLGGGRGCSVHTCRPGSG